MRLSRRSFMTKAGIIGVSSIASFPSVALGAKAKIVIIGGGVGGVMSARHLLNDNSNVSITLVEPKTYYHTPFMSNWTLAGFNAPLHLRHSYDQLSKLDNLKIVTDLAKEINTETKTVVLKSGVKITYDYLILSPGISYQTAEIENYQLLAERQNVSAYADGSEISILRDQIHNMKQGGVLLITAPAYPYRCPPAPYERATMAAYWFKKHNPTAKILIVDEKDSFAMQGLFETAWGEEYDGLIERIPVDFAGKITGISDVNNGVVTEYDQFDADVLSFIPNQKAGIIASVSGLTDETAWCPVDMSTFQSSLADDVYILGDSAYASPIPKSAAAAISQSKLVAQSIAYKMGNIARIDARLSNICWSRVGIDDAIQTSANYEYSKGMATANHSFTSDIEENLQHRLAARMAAETWYKETTNTMFS